MTIRCFMFDSMKSVSTTKILVFLEFSIKEKQGISNYTSHYTVNNGNNLFTEKQLECEQKHVRNQKDDKHAN